MIRRVWEILGQKNSKVPSNSNNFKSKLVPSLVSMGRPTSPLGTVMSGDRNLSFIETETGKMAQYKFFPPSGLSSCLGLNLCSESWKFFPLSFGRACEKSNDKER